jgi:hypothetical protein
VSLGVPGTDAAVTDVELPLGADGTWSGSLALTPNIRAGPLDLDAGCEGLNQASNSDAYSSYVRMTFTVTAS